MTERSFSMVRGMGRGRRVVAIGGAAAALVVAMVVVSRTGDAGESCVGLDGALRNNLNFVAEQRRDPDELSDARIANREAVIDLLQQRRRTAGCTARVVADAAPAGTPAAGTPAASAPGSPAARPPAGGGGGDQVCAGSTVTFFAEAGAPAAASSNQFPVGTELRVTNQDNNRSVVVEVTGPSGSCVLLNNAAFDQIREPGKNLVRRALVQRVG